MYFYYNSGADKFPFQSLNARSNNIHMSSPTSPIGDYSGKFILPWTHLHQNTGDSAEKRPTGDSDGVMRLRRRCYSLQEILSCVDYAMPEQGKQSINPEPTNDNSNTQEQQQQQEKHLWSSSEETVEAINQTNLVDYTSTTTLLGELESQKNEINTAIKEILRDLECNSNRYYAVKGHQRAKSWPQQMNNNSNYACFTRCLGQANEILCLSVQEILQTKRWRYIMNELHQILLDHVLAIYSDPNIELLINQLVLIMAPFARLAEYSVNVILQL